MSQADRLQSQVSQLTAVHDDQAAELQTLRTGVDARDKEVATLQDRSSSIEQSLFDMQRKCEGLQETLVASEESREQQHQLYADRQRTYMDTEHRLQSQLHSARSHVQKELRFQHRLLHSVGSLVFPSYRPPAYHSESPYIEGLFAPLSGKTTPRPTTFEGSPDDFHDDSVRGFDPALVANVKQVIESTQTPRFAPHLALPRCLLLVPFLRVPLPPRLRYA